MKIELIANAITAVTSLLALIISIYVFAKQNKQAAITLGVSVLREYESDFFASEEMLRKRYVTSQFLLHRKPGDSPPQEAYELLDFFDILGLHVEKNAVEADMVWSTFHYWFDKYWHLLQDDVEELYRNYTDGVRYLDHCATLHRRLDEFGLRHRGLPSSEVRHQKAKLDTFLEEEIEACKGYADV